MWVNIWIQQLNNYISATLQIHTENYCYTNHKNYVVQTPSSYVGDHCMVINKELI